MKRLILLFLLVSAGFYAHAAQPPNIILIVVDDLGWRDLGCYGRGDVFETPNIDQLAKDGIRFTQSYANCPVCSPSRAAIMTGKDPARLQFTGHITAIGRHRYPEQGAIIPPDDFMYLPHEELTLAEALKQAGYRTASMGKWHLGHEGYWPEDHGFDVNIGGWTHGSPPNYFYPFTKPKQRWNPSIPNLDAGEEGDYLTDVLTDEALRFMEESRDAPFFLYLPYYAVHTPLQAPEALIDKYTRKLGDKQVDIDPVYAAMVEIVDDNMGRIMAKLKKLRLAKNTVIIFTSDNGGLVKATTNSPLRLGKSYLYEGGIRIPCIIKWPGKISRGSQSDTMIAGTDLFPTILAMAQQPLPKDLQLDGVDLTPLWNGTNGLERDTLFWYYPHYGLSKEPAAAVRKGGYKLIHFYDPPRTELYNLEQDLKERNNLADTQPEKVQELYDAL